MNDNTTRTIAIGAGLLISLFVLWFGFRLIQSRFGQASTKVANVECVQDEESASTYVASFELGSASSNVDCEWGLSADSLGSIAEGDCSGTSCTCTMPLVPPGAAPSFKILVGGTHIGQGEAGDETAPAFICEETALESVKTPTRQPTQPKPTPTVALDVSAAIRAEFDTWNEATVKQCTEKYGALNCARYLTRPDPDANISETSSN